MMSKLYLITLGVIFFASSGRCANYTLLVPSKVNAGTNLEGLLTILYDSPSDVTAKITSSEGGDSMQTSIPSPDGNGEVTSVSIAIPADYSGDYVLEVSNDVFTAKTEFEVVSVPYAILIQTDKPIYKPSQIVNIRVAAIDHNLLPRNETVDVIVEDAEGNKLKQWRDQQLNMGLAQFSLPLSDRPPLGEWKITVSSADVEQEKTIKIDEYVLPRFEVNVGLPSYVLKTYNQVDIEVSAVYTYGEDVNGDLSLKITTSTGSIVKNGLKISGTTSLSLLKADLNELGLTDGTSMTVEASVYEPLSGKTLSGSAQTPVESTDYQISFMDINSKSYRVGQDYTCYYKVAKPDGSAIDEDGHMLKVTLMADNMDGGLTLDTDTKSVPSDGIVAITVTFPGNSGDGSGNYWYPRLQPQLTLADGEVIKGELMDDLSKFRSENEEIYLQISADITGVPNVGDSIEVTVSASSTTGVFAYMASSRGRLVTYGTGDFSSPTFNLAVAQDFTPQVTLVVYATLEGEVLADSVQFNVEGAFQNEVSLEFRSSDNSVVTEAKPGDEVTVRVQSDAGSVVGLLSVDKSVLLLGSGNDITQSQILTELMSLVKSESSCGDDEEDGGGFRFFWFPRFGGETSEDIISSAGMTVVTDGDIQGCGNDPWLMRGDMLEDGIMFKFKTSAADGSESSSPAAAKRQFFPETWLWDLLSSETGTVDVAKIVPDTITSWVATAISMNPTTGISVTPQATELTVKLDFFITPILPYSAVKGEELAVRIVANNYGSLATESCTITVHSSEQYEVKWSENDIYMTGEEITQVVSVEKSKGYTVTLWLRPSVIDTIILSASASCQSGASDAFERSLLVKPAGIPVDMCSSELIQIETNGDDVTHTFDTRIATEYVADSKRVQVMVTGDVMGPSIDGLDHLIQMPYGCGEQNMITFTPNIFVRRYLESINKADIDTKTKTDTFMETGYQRELTYKHSDGSFSAFGESDPSGSTWLTAFVMKCFRQAKEYIDVDQTVLDRAVSWLNNQKGRDGMFGEPGRVIHTEMQGGTSSGITLTAFVVISMLEDVTESDLNSRISELSTTVSYLEGKLSDVESSAYQLSVITYALTLAQSSQAAQFLAKLEDLQQSEGGEVWWTTTDSSPPTIIEGDIMIPPQRSSPSSVEMTSYALLTYLAMNENAKAKPLAMWLTKSRSGTGGWHGTQDTVLGLQALAGYAASVISDSTDLFVVFNTDTSESYNHSITADNAIITKKNSFKPAELINQVTVTLSGVGSAIVTTCTGYNVRSNRSSTPSTYVSTEVTRQGEDDTGATLTACVMYNGEGDSGMGLTEVFMATGYSAATDDVTRQSGDLALVEQTDNGLAVYWNQLTNSESCFEVKLTRESEVKEVQDTYVVASQYYSSDVPSRSFYNPSAASLVVDGPGGSAVRITSTALIVIAAVTHYIF